MSLERVGATAPNYAPCNYGTSRMVFRGPKAALDQPYIACLGGTETFGKFVQRPFPAVLEDLTGRPCVNLGSVNAGVDSFNGDVEILDIATHAELCVLQIMGMENLSNRFYKVHPRRNDRFVSASEPLRAIFKSVDFTEFTFTRHMLAALKTTDEERYDIVVEELKISWANRMRDLVAATGPHTCLLWLRPAPGSLAADDPLQVTEEMVENLRSSVSGVIEVPVQAAGEAQELPDMTYGPLDGPMAELMLGPRAHETIAQSIQVDLMEKGPI